MKISDGISKIYYKAGLSLKHNSSSILSFIAAAGVVGTAILTAKSTPKAILLIEQAEEKKGDDLNIFETVVAAGPAYIPSILLGASTITCIFGANVLNKRQQASLTSAYAFIENSYKEYRNKVKELFGENADRQVTDAIRKDKIKENWNAYTPGVNSLSLTDDVCLFYDEIGERYFEAKPSYVFNAEYHLNRNFALRGCANLNEFYNFLGLEETEIGDSLGWSGDGFYETGMCPWIDFDHFTNYIEDGSEDGLKCISICPVVEPSLYYDAY